MTKSDHPSTNATGSSPPSGPSTEEIDSEWGLVDVADSGTPVVPKVSEVSAATKVAVPAESASPPRPVEAAPVVSTAAPSAPAVDSSRADPDSSELDAAEAPSPP